MKIIKVFTCKTCPYFLRKLNKSDCDYCLDSSRIFDVTDTIPDWCKLDDAYISNNEIRGKINDEE